uniref:Uncharacterized protein n=1 Tax=Rhodnius prolixus TaxID=13249 RepID=T1I8Z7_RHOPR
MAIVMSARSKIVVAVIVVTFILAAMLVVASTAGWFHNSHQPMPAPHPLQHPYLKVGIPSIGFSLTKNATLNFHLILLVHPSIKCDASEELFYRLKWALSAQTHLMKLDLEGVGACRYGGKMVLHFLTDWGIKEDSDSRKVSSYSNFIPKGIRKGGMAQLFRYIHKSSMSYSDSFNCLKERFTVLVLPDEAEESDEVETKKKKRLKKSTSPTLSNPLIEYFRPRSSSTSSAQSGKERMKERMN